MMMFGSHGKCTKAVATTSAVVSSEEISGDISDNHQGLLSHTSCRCQNKIKALATETAALKTELDQAPKEN